MIEKMTSEEAKVASYLRDHGDMFDGGDKDDRAELAREWMNCFDDPDTCRDWMEVGFWCPHTAESVSDLGIEPDEVASRCDDLSDEILARLQTDPVYALCNDDLSVQSLLDEDERAEDE